MEKGVVGDVFFLRFVFSIVYVTIRLRVSCMDPERPSFFSSLRFYLNRERREEKARHIIVSIFFA